MPFTNERYLSLPLEERERQEKALEKLRYTHTAELFYSGLAQRALASSVYVNRRASQRAYTEGTDLLPYRRPSGYGSLTIFSEVFYSLDVPDEHDEDFFSRGGGDQLFVATADDPAFVVCLERREPLHRPDYRVVGLQMQTPFNVKDGVKVFSVKDMPVSDVGLLLAQLEEIRLFALENELTIVDPITLSVGKGLMYDTFPKSGE